MKFQIHQQRDGFRYWPMGTVEASDKAVAEAERLHGPGKYVADMWHPPIGTGLPHVPRYAPSRRANGTRWR